MVSGPRVRSWKVFGVTILNARGWSVKRVNMRVCGENVDWVRTTKKEEEIRYLQRKCRLQGNLAVVEFAGIGGIAGFLEWNEVERSFRHVGVKTMKSTTCSENVEWG